MSQGATLSHAGLVWVAGFQIAGVVVTSLGVLGALYVVVRRDPKAAREREVDRDRERMVALSLDAERHEREERNQAKRISAWYAGLDPNTNDHLTRRIVILNRSEEPVYNVLLFGVYIQGAAYRTAEELLRNVKQMRDEGGYLQMPYTAISILAPGKYATTIVADTGFHHAVLSVEIAFTDVGGRHWLRRTSGLVERLEADPISHFEIERPISYRTLEE